MAGLDRSRPADGTSGVLSAVMYREYCHLTASMPKWAFYEGFVSMFGSLAIIAGLAGGFRSIGFASPA
jgi:hypothetical protein